VRLEATALAGDGIAVRSDLPYHEAKTAVLHDLERRYVADVLARTNGNLSQAAREAGLDRKYLRSLARKHGFVHDGGPIDHED
jgi:transcriptional regulator with GAF, ATPase, and Fis domain